MTAVAFHDDLIALAQHARVDPDPDIRAAAHRLLTGDHALIPELARTDWAEAVTYGDGEVRFRGMDDEQEARKFAAHTNTHQSLGSKATGTDVAHSAAVYREVRMLVDGTQIIGPWMAPANQFTRGQQ
ncbi:hypothetical protein ACFYUR_18955 [Micromonospora haikouensis]|uniref:hypothetical protein n=1 Tax=Micromonospora haikouensis TaxID=686309 RepID=UPI0036AE4EA1